MGLWHSTPLTGRHKSKVSLTWVLKENKLPLKKPLNDERMKAIIESDRNKHQRVSQKIEKEYPSTFRLRETRQRVVGRNEDYYNLKLKSVYEGANENDMYSDDTSVVTEDYARRRHRHRHRRKKRRSARFGYDIKDLDRFLTDASIDRPGNIPVVIAYPTTLHQTQKELQRELTLPLGTVVNAVFKNQQWLYAQTPHGNEGYVLYSACLPLGILPNRTPQKKTPCWESSTDIYPRPCGNLTDTEKEQMRGRTRSEHNYRSRSEVRPKKQCAEKNFDNLYLRTKSASNIDNIYVKEDQKQRTIKRQVLLVVNCDYKGSELNDTLSVERGEVVILVQKGQSDENTDWFYVRKKDGNQGYIPSVIAGNGYI